MPKQDAQKPALACNLGAMSAQQREQHRALGEKLRGEIQEILETPDGIALRLPPEAWTLVTEFVPLEKLCCPFVRFVLELSEEGGPLLLSLAGRDGVKELLRAELGLDSPRIP
jgi:hypothetical protein